MPNDLWYGGDVTLGSDGVVSISSQLGGSFNGIAQHTYVAEGSDFNSYFHTENPDQMPII